MPEHMHDIRTAPATELDRWDAQLIAIAAHTEARRAESMGRVETHRRLVHAAASRIRRLLAHTEGVSALTRAGMDIAFDQLRIALAAARPTDQGSFTTEASVIADAVRAFDAEIDRAAGEGGEELTEDLGILARDFVATTDAFAAELAAAKWWLGAACEEANVEADLRRQALQSDLDHARDALRLARLRASDPAEGLVHQQIATAIARLRQTFQRLAYEGGAVSPT